MFSGTIIASIVNGYGNLENKPAKWTLVLGYHLPSKNRDGKSWEERVSVIFFGKKAEDASAAPAGAKVIAVVSNVRLAQRQNKDGSKVWKEIDCRGLDLTVLGARAQNQGQGQGQAQGQGGRQGQGQGQGQRQGQGQGQGQQQRRPSPPPPADDGYDGPQEPTRPPAADSWEPDFGQGEPVTADNAADGAF